MDLKDSEDFSEYKILDTNRIECEMKDELIRYWLKVSFTVILYLLAPGLFAQTAEQKPLPRDTSYTLYQAWIKIKKDFPGAKIVYPGVAKSIRTAYDMVYSTLPETPYGRRELKLDIFRPAKPGKYPAVILVHGGGWRSGNKSMQVPLAMQIATQGYVTACVEYRLSPEALYPAAVYDLKAAVRFLRANALKFSIDPDRIAISGSSAGGQLAALTGMSSGLDLFDGNEGDTAVSAKVQAIIDMDGILDFTDPNESAKDNNPAKPSAGAQWLGVTYKADPGKWIEASPVLYGGKNTPPILFVNSSQPRYHAGRDSLIRILDTFGVYSEVHTLNGAPHTFWLFDPWFETTVEYMVDFLDKIFKNPGNK